MSRVRGSIAAVIATLCLLCAGPGALAAPQLRLDIGFDEQFVRKQFAPVRVEVAGLAEPISGRLVLVQDSGRDILDPRSLRFDVAEGRIEDGIYEATLPIYDPIYPVEAQLLDAAGRVIAAETKNVRLAAREEPFPVVVGTPLRFHGTESIVDAAALPRDAWAYSGAKGVWIASTAVSQPQWEALAEWTTGGGSIVLFSGSSFFQLDSPLVRALLPITSPTLRAVAEVEHLVGALRPGASVILERAGVPLLVHRAYGAGHVYLVSCRAEELVNGELQRMEMWVQPAAAIASASQLLKDAIDTTRVLRPFYASSILIGLLCTAVLLGFARLARKRRGMALGFLLAGIAAVSVSAAFYTNWAGRVGFVYSIHTRLWLQTDVGISMDSYGIYSLRPLDLDVPQPRGSYPIQTDFRPRAGADLETTGSVDATRFAVPPGRLFLFRSFAKATTPVSWTISGDDLLVTNSSGSESSGALVVRNGRYYDAGEIAAGSQTIRASELLPVGASTMQPAERSLYRAVSDWLPVRQGDWLIVAFEREADVMAGPFVGRERVVDVIVVAGGAS